MVKMFKVCVIVIFLLAGISFAEKRELHPNVKKFLEEMDKKHRDEKAKKQEKARQDRARKNAEKLEEKAEEREKKIKERRVGSEIIQTFVLWTESGKDSDREKIEQLINEAISFDSIGAREFFTLGQIAYLSGNYDIGVIILKEGIDRYPKVLAPTGGLPMRITARFLLAAIYRQNDNYAEAVEVYEALRLNLNLENEQELVASSICSLYLAEIASEYMDKKPQSILELDKIKKAKRPSKNRGVTEQFEFYSHWANYKRIKHSKGRDLADKAITFDEQSASFRLYAANHLVITGMCPDPVLPLKVMDAIQKQIYLHANRSKKDSLDKCILLLYLGYDKECRKKYDQADLYYSELFEKKSFLSPIAGVYLSGSKDKQGKYAEADNILEDVKNRYPGYDEMISRIKKERVKRRRKRDG